MDATRYLSFIFNSVLHSLLWHQKPPPSAATCHGWSSKYVESCVESPSTAFSCLLFFFLLKTLSFCYPRFKRGHENFLPFFAQTEHSETTCLPLHPIRAAAHPSGLHCPSTCSEPSHNVMRFVWCACVTTAYLTRFTGQVLTHTV